MREKILEVLKLTRNNALNMEEIYKRWYKWSNKYKRAFKYS